MSNIVKTVLSTLLITMSVSGSALAAPISYQRTYTGEIGKDNSASVIVTANGTEIEYSTNTFGKVFTTVPKVVKTVTQGEPGNTIKYNVNMIGNHTSPTLDHYIAKSGDYMTVNNIVKEGTYSNTRIVYSGGPVDVKFNTQYFEFKELMKHESYTLDDKGEVAYSSITPGIDSNGSGYHKIDDTYIGTGEYGYTLTEPGLYWIRLCQPLCGGMNLFVCIDNYYANGSGQGQVVNDNKAVPGAVDVSVNGKWTNVPCYTMNGNKYMRVRDLGYILNGTASQFNPYYIAGSKCTNLNQIENTARNATSSYQAIGGELSALSSNTIENPKAYEGYFMAKSKSCNPSAFDVDNKTFIRVDHAAELLGISVSMSDTGNMYIYA